MGGGRCVVGEAEAYGHHGAIGRGAGGAQACSGVGAFFFGVLGSLSIAVVAVFAGRGIRAVPTPKPQKKKTPLLPCARKRTARAAPAKPQNKTAQSWGILRPS